MTSAQKKRRDRYNALFDRDVYRKGPPLSLAEKYEMRSIEEKWDEERRGGSRTFVPPRISRYKPRTRTRKTNGRCTRTRKTNGRCTPARKAAWRAMLAKHWRKGMTKAEYHAMVKKHWKPIKSGSRACRATRHLTARKHPLHCKCQLCRLNDKDYTVGLTKVEKSKRTRLVKARHVSLGVKRDPRTGRFRKTR
jgi:hypothetical protein